MDRCYPLYPPLVRPGTSCSGDRRRDSGYHEQTFLTSSGDISHSTSHERSHFNRGSEGLENNSSYQDRSDLLRNVYYTPKQPLVEIQDQNRQPTSNSLLEKRKALDDFYHSGSKHPKNRKNMSYNWSDVSKGNQSFKRGYYSHDDDRKRRKVDENKEFCLEDYRPDNQTDQAVEIVTIDDEIEEPCKETVNFLIFGGRKVLIEEEKISEGIGRAAEDPAIIPQTAQCDVHYESGFESDRSENDIRVENGQLFPDPDAPKTLDSCNNTSLEAPPQALEKNSTENPNEISVFISGAVENRSIAGDLDKQRQTTSAASVVPGDTRLPAFLSSNDLEYLDLRMAVDAPEKCNNESRRRSNEKISERIESLFRAKPVDRAQSDNIVEALSLSNDELESDERSGNVNYNLSGIDQSISNSLPSTSSCLPKSLVVTNDSSVEAPPKLKCEDDKKNNYFETEKPKRNRKGSLKNDRLWQLKVALVTLHNLHKQKYNILLLSEEVNNLNDAIFFAKKKNHAFFFLFRCVHPEVEKCRKIELFDLHTSDFHVQKFYEAFLFGSNKIKNENKIMVNFCVYSNLQVNNTNFNKQITVYVPNSNEFKFIVPENVDIFQKLRKDAKSENEQIAELIFDSHRKNKKLRLNKIIRKYSVALTNEKVFEVKKQSLHETIVKFTKDFINNHDLSDSAKMLRNYCASRFTVFSEDVEIVLSSNFGKVEKLEKVEKKEEEVSACLPPEPEDNRKSIHEFYQKLSFIKKDINDRLFRKVVRTFNFNEDNFCLIQDNFLNILKKNAQSINNIFKFGLSQIMLDVKFKDNIIQDLINNFRLSECDKIKLFHTKYPILTERKIYQALAEIPQLSCDSYDYIELEADKNVDIILKNIFNAYYEDSTKLLLINIGVGSFDAERLSKKLIEILGYQKLSTTHKKDIIIFGDCHCFQQSFYNHCIVFEDSDGGIQEITENWQNNLLQKSNLTLQNRVFKFADIMNLEEFVEFSTCDVLSKLLVNETMAIGKKFHMDKPYIQRYLKKNQTSSESPPKDAQNQAIFKVQVPAEKISVVRGEAGTGKASYLENLALNFRPSDSTPVWCINECLSNGVVDQIRQKISHAKDRLIILFLQLLHYQSPLDQQFLEMIANGKLRIKLILCLNWIEELSTENFNFVVKLLKMFESTSVNKVIVAISSHLNKNLETEINVLSYHFELLNLDDKKKIILSYWSQNLTANEHKYTEYADRLLEFYGSENRQVDLTCTPHLLSMLAEIHNPFVNSENPEIILNESIDSHRKLYEEFVSIKAPSMSDHERLLVQKSSLKTLSKTSQELSANATEIFKIKSNISDQDASYELPDELTHSTFAEFFVVEYILKTISSLPNNPHKSKKKLMKSCYKSINELINHSSPIFVSCLLDLLNEHHLLQNFLDSSVTNDCDNILITLLRRQPTEDGSDLEERLFNRASENGNHKIVLFFLKRNSKLNFENALNLAIKNKRKRITLELLLVCKKFDYLDGEFCQKLIEYVAVELSKVEVNENHKYQPISEKLFEKQSSQVLQVPKLNLPRILSYFFSNGRIKIIKSLLENVNDETRRKFFESCDGKNPIEIVNSSQTIKDEEKMDMILFLLENDALDPNNYWCSILVSAMKNNHTKTFKCFIDNYNGGCVKLLKDSIRDNKFENIDFLCKNEKFSRDPETKDTVLHIAIKMDANLAMLDFLIGKTGINYENNKGETPLCVAIKLGADLLIIEHLIKKGADINSKDTNEMFTWCYAFTNDSKYQENQQFDLFSKFFKLQRKKARDLPERLEKNIAIQWKKEIEKNLRALDKKFEESDRQAPF